MIDAWNKLEHKDDKTTYMGEALDEIVRFCELQNVHCFLVAHPTKMPTDMQTGKRKIPTLYDIAGSANFYNKADNGICVYRDFELEKAFVHIQKIKFDHWGTEGVAEFSYDVKSKRYYDGVLDNRSWLKPQTLAEEMRNYKPTNYEQETFDIF